MTRSALIVAHGQPSAPAAAEADLAQVAKGVAGLLPGWAIGSATLAQPGALEAALAETSAPLIFPFFMSDGWFSRVALPRRLAEAGVHGGTILAPFGLMKAAADLATASALATVRRSGWRVEDSVVVLAAHGSARGPAPAQSARGIQSAVAAMGFAEVRLGFLEEEPALQDVASGAGTQALCLPLFVASWGHVLSDIPAALAVAGFRGPCLAPLGLHPEVPGIIAEALRDS